MLELDIKLAQKLKFIMKKSDKIFIAGHNGLVGSAAAVNLLKKRDLRIY